MLPKTACVGLMALLYFHFYISVAVWNLEILDYPVYCNILKLCLSVNVF